MSIASQVSCDNCGFYSLCKIAGLGSANLDILNEIMVRCHPIDASSVLFEIGDNFDAIYAVKSGSFKTHMSERSGVQHVVGFHFPGELIGLEAIKSRRYEYTATPLEQSDVCKLKFDELSLLGDRLPEFQRRIIDVMSDQLQQLQYLSIVTSQQAAERRLAFFLINLSKRFIKHGQPATQFRLSMPRNDIASYLGLSMETVSRLFSRYQKAGVLNVRGKNIQLLQIDRLRSMNIELITQKKENQA